VTSTRKIEANRKNARASTGPKTAQGRARLARNALRHGFSLPVCSDPVLCEEVESLARKIAGTEANVEIRELARRIAEAQIDLHRVRYARRRLLSHTLSEPYHASRGDTPDTAALADLVTSTSEGPQKFALILSQKAKQLAAMDRYEKRALSRRKSAIRAFDEARRR
jgi:hypothetical protein